jgi:DNA (cytosine-5)-methyltransferase 1
MKRGVKRPIAIDLFSGCGGITCGLQRAGFDVIAGFDCEESYIQTYAHNFGNDRAHCVDLRNIDPIETMNALGVGVGELDLLAGGPPCQGFSKNVPRSKRSAESANNLLIHTFLNFVEKIKPRSVLMENVAEMKNGFDQRYSEALVEQLGALGYGVAHHVVVAADFGVPQRRRRAFFMAVRGSTPQFPSPTHTESLSHADFFDLRRRHVTVWEAIGDFPSLAHGEGQEFCGYASKPTSDYQKIVRNGSKRVRNHVARHLAPIQYERLSSLMPGQGIKDLPEHIRPNGGYSGAYGRLTEDMIAPTITRWVFHPGSGRWGHPRDIRVLTIREAARIQGFPDDFEFVGTYNEQAGQVGNAVPPLLAEAFGKQLLLYL